jgi:hypothetical protein
MLCRYAHAAYCCRTSVQTKLALAGGCTFRLAQFWFARGLHDASDAPRSLVRRHDTAWLGEGHFPSLSRSIAAADAQHLVCVAAAREVVQHLVVVATVPLSGYVLQGRATRPVCVCGSHEAML